jgi:hypothetical protein
MVASDTGVKMAVLQFYNNTAYSLFQRFWLRAVVRAIKHELDSGVCQHPDCHGLARSRFSSKCKPASEHRPKPKMSSRKPSRTKRSFVPREAKSNTFKLP